MGISFLFHVMPSHDCSGLDVIRRMVDPEPLGNKHIALISGVELNGFEILGFNQLHWRFISIEFLSEFRALGPFVSLRYLAFKLCIWHTSLVILFLVLFLLCSTWVFFDLPSELLRDCWRYSMF